MLPERITSKITIDRGGCWLWHGAIDRNGYGIVYWKDETGKSRTGAAHRYIYQQVVGPVPQELTCDHLCRVKHCVNPEHIEVVTHRENNLRGNSLAAQRARQTHCVNGHPLDGEHLVISQGVRRCRTCSNRRSREAKRKRRSTSPVA